MRFGPRAYISALICLTALPCRATNVGRLIVTRSVDERSCVVPKPADAFQTTQREAFVWFTVNHAASGDQVKVEWLAPDGAAALEAEYRDLPAAPSLCLVTRLPIAGFDAASQPGQWTARVSAGGRTLASKSFRIAGPADGPGGLRVSSVQRRATSGGVELIISGAGFSSESLVHIAQYTPSGGWRYVAASQPRSITATQIVADQTALPAAEYLVIVRNPNGALSAPMPFVVPTAGYKLPTVAGEPWIVTQGPYGAFSHWGRSLHAYDIAPRSGRCIVAMKAGIVHVHDIGARQDHARRTFGNYITIDHGNGEYSHYAHLASGTFVVSEGQHVEQGQALAVVGNSGYTLGEGGGYHVHVHVTRSPSISAPSVPFQFEELRGPVRGQMTVVSSNVSPLCDCSRHVAGAVATEMPKQFSGAVSVGQWWNDIVEVRKHAASFEAVLGWDMPDSGLDLHLVSPSGHHYGWYADTTGYSGRTRPQRFRIPRPEPGLWRISVQAVQGGVGQIGFWISSSGTKATPAMTRTLRASTAARPGRPATGTGLRAAASSASTP